MAAILPARMPTSARRAAAPEPSITAPPAITRSYDSCPYRETASRSNTRRSMSHLLVSDDKYTTRPERPRCTINRMNRLWRYGAPVVLLALARPAVCDSEVERVVREVRSEVRPGDAMDRMQRIYSTDHWFTFPNIEKTAAYLKGVLGEIGLKRVEMVSPPADGTTQYGFWTMPLAWDVKQATLEIVEPDAPPDIRALADFQKIPASLVMWGSPTPPGGITAEVVELRSFAPAEMEKADLKGKMVLVRQDPSSHKGPLIAKGAAGVISAATENPRLRDGHNWVNSWGDSGWGYTKQSHPLVCFSISPRQADFISGVLAKGQKVRVKANVDARYYSGTYPYTTGVIEGTSPEEVLTLGHTAEQGASDNANGVSVMVEAMATLQRLIGAGKLKQPRRTIRILTMPELYATMHYITVNPERIRRTVAAICLDTPAGPHDQPLTFMLTPDVASSYINPLVLNIAETYLSGLSPRRGIRWTPYRAGTDTFMSDPMIGVPTVAASAPNVVNVHHNSEDTPDRLDRDSTRDLAVVTAAFVYYVASAGDAEIPWLAQITADRAHENVLRVTEPALKNVETAGKAEELARLLFNGQERIAYAAARGREAVLSTLRLASPGGREKLAPALKQVEQSAAAQSSRLSEAVDRRAAALGIARPVKALAPPADPQLTEAAGMIVKRKRFGTVTLDDLPMEQWEGQPSAAWDANLITALNWCDGKRNLAEVIRLTRLERGQGRTNLVSWFQFLARHGYVELISAAK